MIDCIKKQQESKGITQEEILVQFDDIFWNKNGKNGNISVSKFVVELTKRKIHQPPNRKKRRLPTSIEIDNDSNI